MVQLPGCQNSMRRPREPWPAVFQRIGLCRDADSKGGGGVAAFVSFGYFENQLSAHTDSMRWDTADVKII